MSIKIDFLGHATFMLTSGEHRVLIDPFLTGNPKASTTADQLDPTAICITHGHADHMADAASIAKRTGATVYSAFEICEYLGEQGIENLEPGNPGGSIAAPFGHVSFTPAVHSSSFEGRYMGMPMGVVVELIGKRIYHLGDTGLFGDLKLIGDLHQPHAAIIPVGDRFTMGPAHAKVAAEMIGAPVAIPCHYGTWPLLVSDISAFTPDGIEVEALQPGASLTLE